MSATNANIIELPTAETAAVRRLEEYGVLLARPREVLAPDHEYGYRLRDGEVGRCGLERLRLPESVRPGVLAMPGPVGRHTLRTLPAAAAMLDRMAPWVTGYVVPTLLVSADDGDYAADRVRHVVGGREYTTAGGVACIEQNVIVLSGVLSATRLLSAGAHEIFHVIEPLLSDASREVLSDAVAQGHGWPGAYFGCEQERVARLFENWVSSVLEGQPRRPVPTGQLTVDSIFQAIWDGTVANELLIDGRVPDAARLRAQRGLCIAEPARPSVLERLLREAFGGLRAAFA